MGIFQSDSVIHMDYYKSVKSFTDKLWNDTQWFEGWVGC